MKYGIRTGATRERTGRKLKRKNQEKHSVPVIYDAGETWKSIEELMLLIGVYAACQF